MLYKIIILFCLLQMAFSSPAFCIAFEHRDPDYISLKGRVLNITGNAIGGVKINLESEKYFYRTTSDQNGNYSFTVPDDIYRFYTDTLIKPLKYTDEFYMPPGCSSYFRPSRRANINILFQKPAIFDLILIESGAMCSWQEGDKLNSDQVGFFEQYSHTRPHSRIEYETLFQNQYNSFDMVIQYGYREEKNSQIYYSTVINADFPSLFGKEFPFTIITYDSLVIYAKKVFVYKKKKSIHILNAYIVENGKEKIKWNEINIDMKNSVPKFSFKN